MNKNRSRHYLPITFLEFVNKVRILGIKSSIEYQKVYKVNKLPCDPKGVFKDEFTSWGEITGANKISNRIKSKLWLGIDAFIAEVKPFLLRTQNEYLIERKKNNHDWPSNPEQIYGQLIWSKVLCEKWFSYDEARAYCEERGIDSYASLKKARKSNKLLPSNPTKFYKKDLKGELFFTPRSKNGDQEFYSFEEVKSIVINKLKYEFNLNSSPRWRIEISKIFRQYPHLINKIPSRPDSVYMHSGWLGWTNFLGNEKPILYTFNELKTLVRREKITTCSSLFHYRKNKPDYRIPSNPKITYNTSGWISYPHLFGTRKSPKFINRYQGEKGLKKLRNKIERIQTLGVKITSQSEYKKFARSFNLPMNTQAFFGSHWKGWNYLLGESEKGIQSKGEKFVEKFLNSRGIKYNTEYALPCKHKAKLRADFYLPEQNTIIEFHGIQHFYPVAIFGGKKEFLETQQRDKIKRNYCSNKGIRLIEFNYLNLEDEIDFCLRLDKVLLKKVNKL